MIEWVRPGYRLLLAAAAVEPRPTPTSGVDWKEIRRLAVYHRLEGLLDLYLNRAGVSVPESVAEQLRDRRHEFAVSEIAARLQLDEVSATLHRAGVKSVALKGMALVDSAYEEAGLRALGDIDLLIAPHDLSAAVDALSTAGYQERSARLVPRAGATVREHHHHNALRHPNHTLMVELHIRPTFRGRSEAAPVLDGALPNARGGCLLPDPHDHLVILAAHFISDRDIRRDSLMALAQLADIARVAREAQLDRVARRAAGWGLAWETFAALDAVRVLGLCHLSEAELAPLRPSSWRALTTTALLRHRVLVDSPLSGPTPWRSPGFRASVLPGRHYLRARYGMPSASVARLYMTRAQAAARRALPLVMATLRQPRRRPSEIILARRLRAK
jgi:hypothetical protein